MHTLITSFNGISNIGLYAFANDKFILLGKEVPLEEEKRLEAVFKVPIHRITIAGTSFIGVFVAGNNEKIIVPEIIFEEEKEELDSLGIPYEIFSTRLTCLGNNIAIGKNIIVNPEFTDSQANKIGEIFDLPVSKRKIADTTAIGSLIVMNPKKNKALVTNEASDEEASFLETNLGVEATPGSVNMGSPHVRSGIICNKNGFAIGKNSGGPEITNADEALGFLE